MFVHLVEPDACNWLAIDITTGSTIDMAVSIEVIRSNLPHENGMPSLISISAACFFFLFLFFFKLRFANNLILKIIVRHVIGRPIIILMLFKISNLNLVISQIKVWVHLFILVIFFTVAYFSSLTLVQFRHRICLKLFLCSIPFKKIFFIVDGFAWMCSIWQKFHGKSLENSIPSYNHIKCLEQQQNTDSGLMKTKTR